MPISAKSLSRVAIASASTATAVAAIIASASAIGRPAASRTDLMVAHSAAATGPNESVRAW